MPASDHFVPLFRSPDLQTVAGRLWPSRIDESVWPTETWVFRTSDEVQVLARYNRSSNRAPGTIVAVHGLTGSSESQYMRVLAHLALQAGLDVLRLNVRNCGGTEHLASTLYHSGLTDDLRSVVEELAPQPVVLAGFSMGGNMALKLAGEWEGRPPAHVKGVCGISVPIQLAACVKRLGDPRNRFYEQRFLRALCRVLRTKQRLMPTRFSWIRLNGIRNMRDFDNAVTAPAFGFADADDYYGRASSCAYISKIHVPALLIQAKDDPFIPFQIFEHPALANNPHLQLIATKNGGHVAFLARERPRFWAQDTAIKFALQQLSISG